MQAITDPQYNYLKGLIRKVDKEFYNQVRLNEKINPDLRERQLSKKQAQRLIAHLKVEADSRKKVRTSVGFDIETPFGTVMFAGSEKRLLQWAEARFKREQPSLKKVEAFTNDAQSTAVEVSQYKIRRKSEEEFNVS